MTWYKVDSCLPPVGKDVLVHVEYTDPFLNRARPSYMAVDRVSRIFFDFRSNLFGSTRVTHWSSMPKVSQQENHS
jgi:hypothetical protein